MKRSGNRCLIGWGNELRGDDAAGRLVARRVTETDGVAVFDVHQLTPELAVHLADADDVLFVDAFPATESDTIQITRIHSETDSSTAHSPHHLTPGRLLHLAASLYGRAPRAQLLAIPALTFEIGAPPTAHTQAGMHAALQAIDHWLHNSQERDML